MATPNDCIQIVEAAAGRSLSQEQREQIFNSAQARIARYTGAGLGLREAGVRAGMELAQEHQANAARLRGVALQNLRKRVDGRTRMTGWAEGPMARSGTPRPDLALQAAVTGTADPRAVGGRFGTEGKAIVRSKDYAAGIQHELRQAGLEGVARSGTLDAQVWKEMHALSPAGKLAGEKPGWSGSTEATKIAAIYHKYYALARVRLNEQGALIGDVLDFVQHNSHDPIKLEKAGFEAWRDATLPRLDQARTFEEATAEGISVDDFMRSVWNALATGVHLSDSGAVGFKEAAFYGPANLAKKLSQQRLLHWKDAQSGFDYFKQFGMNGTMGEMLARSMDRAARQEMLMRDWGTNPQSEFDNTIRWFEEKYRDTNHEAVARLQNAAIKLQSDFKRLTGENNRPANQLVSTWGHGLRSLEVMGKLGNVLFSHLSSTSTAARELQRQGEGVFESYRNALASWFGGLQGVDAREAHDLLSASLEGSHAALASNAWLENGPPGAISTMQNLFMRATGLPYAIGWKKAGVAAGVARILGRQLDRGFADLDPNTRIAFDQYGIGEKEWNALRAVADPYKDSGGRVLLDPSAALRTRLAPAERETLALKLATYLSDTADRATITPRITDRNRGLFGYGLGGTRPGTPEGELARFFMQFKSWPVAMARQTFDAEFRSGRRLSSSIPGTFQLIAGMTILGYLRNTVAGMASGKNPAPITPATLFHSLAQGGGAGIYGDFLFGNSSRFGQSIAETMAGPVLGQGLDLLSSTWNDLRDYAAGEKKSLDSTAEALVRTGQQMIQAPKLVGMAIWLGATICVGPACIATFPLISWTATPNTTPSSFILIPPTNVPRFLVIHPLS